MINAQKTAPVVTYTELWHWGTMIYGEANDGYSTVLPYNIPGNYVSGSSGLSYTMAVKNDGTLWGWGAGGFGKLGDGGTTNRSSPVQIGTLTISSPPASNNAGSFVLIFTADGTARSVTWGASVLWPGGIAPTLTSTNGKKDVFGFISLNSGTNWYGFIGGQNI